MIAAVLPILAFIFVSSVLFVPDRQSAVSTAAFEGDFLPTSCESCRFGTVTAELGLKPTLTGVSLPLPACW